MTVKYWVGDFFVDLSRNQVTQKEQSQTIAPKALAVLTYLAEHQGKVVSYDELFDKVWPDTVVTPNTLQRSIAQLRKVLGENTQYQSYIKTHTKQGYSLECEDRCQDQIDAEGLWDLDAKVEMRPELIAPIAEGEEIGQISIRLGDKEIAARSLIALEAINEAGFFGRAWDGMSMWIGGFFGDE